MNLRILLALTIVCLIHLRPASCLTNDNESIFPDSHNNTTNLNLLPQRRVFKGTISGYILSESGEIPAEESELGMEELLRPYNISQISDESISSNLPHAETSTEENLTSLATTKNQSKASEVPREVSGISKTGTIIFLAIIIFLCILAAYLIKARK